MAARKKKGRSVRASSLVSTGKCIGSQATAEEALVELGLQAADLSGMASQLGRAYHKLVELSATTTVDTDDVILVSTAFGVEFKHLWHLWSRVEVDHKEGYPDEIVVEEGFKMEFGNVTLTGTPDRVRRFGTTLEVDDWKTGRLIAEGVDADAEEHGQLQAYMLLALQRDWGVEIKRVIGRLYSIRDQRTTDLQLSQENFPKLHAHIETMVLQADAQRDLDLDSRDYTVDDHCRWCQGRAICPAYRESANTALAPFLKEPDKASLTNAARALIREDPGRAWLLRTIANQVNDALKDALKDAVEWEGAIEVDETHEIRSSEFDRPSNINENIVRESLSQAEVDDETINLVMQYVDLNRAAKSFPVKRVGKFKKKKGAK